MTQTTEKISGLAPLKNKDFCFLLTGFAIGQMLMPLQFITQILWVQEYAPKDVWLILVALIGASRGMGALLFGLYGGALADRFDRRKLMLVTQFLLILTTVAISALMFFSVGSTLGFILFFSLTFLSAGLLSIDAPTRLAIIPDILGPQLTPAGMALSQAAAQLSMPMAMVGIGLIVEALGFSGAYLFSATGHIVAIICIALMSYRSPLADEAKPAGPYRFTDALGDIREGLRYTWQHPVVFWIVALLFSMMALGFPATANLGPTWITTVVGVPIPQVGFVVMTWGLGALAASLLLTWFSSIERRGLL
ncbi:MAG: MFS transporter, partial [Pseudomonadota bacterium]